MGIAVGIDPRLPASLKLEVHTGCSPEHRAVTSIAWVHNHCQELCANNDDIRAGLVNSAAAIAYFDLISREDSDSDMQVVNTSIPSAKNPLTAAWEVWTADYTMQDCPNAATMMRATKINR